MANSFKKVALFFSSLAVFLCCAFAFSTPALAKDYALTKTDIVANVNADASMNVVQSRTFDFDGEFSLMMIPLGTDQAFTINSVTLGLNTRAKGEGTALEEVAFQTSWRKSGGPNKSCYSIDKDNGTVYVFTDSDASTQTVTLDYVYSNALKVHDDVAELYWKFVSEAWERTSSAVSCTINIPVPAGTTPAKEDIRAWAHGNLSGTVKNDGDGIIKLEVSNVQSGEFAEARVIFPTTWMNESCKSTAAYVAGNATDSILAEEGKYADEANAKRQQSMILVAVFVAIPIIFLIITIILYLKFGKEYKPRFTDDYWRDVPDPDYHPCVVARNERWDKQSSSDISATIMHLHVNGFINVEQAKREKSGLLGKREVDDLIISEVLNVDSPTDPIDAQTLKFLFDDVESSVPASEGQTRRLYVSDISAMSKSDAGRSKGAYDKWQGVLDGEVFKADLFEAKGKTIANAYKLISGILFLFAFGTIFFGADFFSGISSDLFMVFLGAYVVVFAISIIFSFFSKSMNRRTHHANEVHAKTKALKKWLCEFTSLNERPALDTKVWGEFMVYATILGVADKAIEQMKIAEPALFDESGFGSTSYLPWWFWFHPNAHSTFANHDTGLDSLNSAFSDFTSAFESGAAGNWSSGGGFGGGFSGGGGGGFGGGGFGGAR